MNDQAETARFDGFPGEGLDFLERLSSEDKSWFGANRDTYRTAVVAPTRRFVVAVGDRLAEAVSPAIVAQPKTNEIKRQVFEAFDLQIAVDKTEGRLEISATVSEDVAKVLNTNDPLAREGLAVVPKDVARTGFELVTSSDTGAPKPVSRLLRAPTEPEGLFER
jgi:hypothetical protein